MKKLLIIVGIVIVAVIILLVVGISNIGPIIKSAVNTYGPQITKTDLHIGDVNISLFTGEAKLKDLLLGNPKGFKSSEAMKVGTIYVDVAEEALTDNPIVINRIAVAAPEITYEKKGRTDNFKTILDNVKKSASAGQKTPSSSEKKEDAGPAKKVLIREVVIKDGRVNLAMTALSGQGVSAALPDIQLKDIGEEKGGITPAQALEVIFSALYKNITAPTVTDALRQGLKGLGPEVKIDGKSTQKTVDSAGDKVKGLFKTKD